MANFDPLFKSNRAKPNAITTLRGILTDTSKEQRTMSHMQSDGISVDWHCRLSEYSELMVLSVQCIDTHCICFMFYVPIIGMFSNYLSVILTSAQPLFIGLI